MSPTYTVTDYLLDRANIHDTVTKLVCKSTPPPNNQLTDTRNLM